MARRFVYARIPEVAGLPPCSLAPSSPITVMHITICYNYTPLPACSASVEEPALRLSRLWRCNNGEDRRYVRLLLPEEMDCEK